MTSHSQLVERAVRWLYNTKHCHLVLTGNACAGEIPDAIGWSRLSTIDGSIVVECKTSLSDFHRDKRKKHTSRMGHYRYFFVPTEIVCDKTVEEHYPDHGLLLLERDRVYVLKKAARRDECNLLGEMEMLRTALVNVKCNLQDRGCSVDLRVLTKYAGQLGITFPTYHDQQGDD